MSKATDWLDGTTEGWGAMADALEEVHSPARLAVYVEEEGGEYNLADHVAMEELAPERTSGDELVAMLKAAINRLGSWSKVMAGPGVLDHFETQDNRLCLSPVYKPGKHTGKPLMVPCKLSLWDDTSGVVVTHVTLNHQEWTWAMQKMLHASVSYLEPMG